MGIFEEEKEHLDYVIDAIDEQRDEINDRIGELKYESTHLSFEDRLRGTHFELNNKLNFFGQDLFNLDKARPNPYFGRIDFVSDYGSKSIIYIGKIGLSHNNKILVTDWRAPICGLYYDSELGKTSYESLKGVESGELTLKRQINIKDSKLIDAFDTELVSDDELLKPYLSNNADNKMKDIVATIQKEQNNIIRMPYNKNIIVQGVAGSGKTSVALHRIAYLIYNLSNKISSDMFLVIGPNEYFLDYISTLLPELDTSPVEQKTLITLFENYVGEKLNVKVEDYSNMDEESRTVYENIDGYKSSLKFKKALDSFLDDYFSDGIVKEDFILENEVIFSKDLIKRLLYWNGSNIPDFKRCTSFLKNLLKNDNNEIFTKLNEKYRTIYTSKTISEEEKKEAVRKSEKLRIALKEDGIKLFSKYMKSMEESILKIYITFISNIEKYGLDLSTKEILYLKKDTLMNLKKRNCSFVDMPALMHIKYRKTGEQLKYNYVIVDEAQDLGLFHFSILKDIMGNAVFSVYGDLAQSIYPYRGIKSWDEVINELFACFDYEFLSLSKSYRTTTEITNNANNVLKHLDFNVATPVIRHGESISYFEKSKDVSFKVDIIKNLINKGYKTIAIICKTDKEVKSVEKLLKDNGIQVKTLFSSDKEYSGGVFVLTSASSKGLEFDAVVINDASENVYSSESKTDMHLLYVASTRALHELVVLYNKNLTQPFNDLDMIKTDDVNVKKLIR